MVGQQQCALGTGRHTWTWRLASAMAAVSAGTVVGRLRAISSGATRHSSLSSVSAPVFTCARRAGPITPSLFIKVYLVGSLSGTRRWRATQCDCRPSVYKISEVRKQVQHAQHYQFSSTTADPTKERRWHASNKCDSMFPTRLHNSKGVKKVDRVLSLLHKSEIGRSADTLDACPTYCSQRRQN